MLSTNIPLAFALSPNFLITSMVFEHYQKTTMLFQCDGDCSRVISADETRVSINNFKQLQDKAKTNKESGNDVFCMSMFLPIIS